MSRLPRRLRLSALRRGLTLIEMLVATAITLLMMAAVVNLFANLTGGIRNRRAVIELSGQLRQTRQRLALDLAGATCPAVPWQRPGDNVGYLEIIEGRWSDSNPSALVDGDLDDDELGTGPANDRDYTSSILPRNNLVRDYDNSRKLDDDDAAIHISHRESLVPGGLGDYDDILALTVRSDAEPFIAQVNGQTVESHLAEVVWFAVENPANGLLGEPGLRTIYRRALIIAPWLDPIPGPPDSQAFFQRHDVSAHYDADKGAWIPNTLGDLTRRENRCYRQSGDGAVSPFPHVMASGGAGYTNNPQVTFARGDFDTLSGNARVNAIVENGSVVAYVVTDGGTYNALPSAKVDGPNLEATARPILAKDPKNPGTWTVAQVTFGPAPLSIHRVTDGNDGSILVDRTGDDVMLSDALAFDLRVYDPGAPVYQRTTSGAGTAALVLVQPGDPGFDATVTPQAYGAYVDMGWRPEDRYDKSLPSESLNLPVPRPIFDWPHQAGWHPRLDIPTVDHTVYPYGWPAEYDTWSLHYESDGIDQDGNATDSNGNGRIDVGDVGVDQGKNGLDDDNANGPDDVAERETAPPYDASLRGVQVRLRLYERDARQIRETSVTRNLVP